MPAMTDSAALSQIGLFHELTSEQLTWLNNQLHLKTFAAGSNILAAETPGEAVYILVEGTIRIFMEQMDGSEVTLAILGPGDTVGELSLIDSAGRSANVVTMEKSKLAWLDRDTFWECLQTMPSVAFELLQIIGERLRLANEQVQALATLDIDGRVARQILAIAQSYGQATSEGDVVIPIRLTQSDLASMVGASRERVNQVIGSYKQHNYISIDQNYRITIHDRQALVERCR